MQDRYAGDLGDYLKFGLLRWLAPPEVPTAPRLGVVWYRTADETHNADGKYITYLDRGHRSSGRLRELDPDLYDRLSCVVAGERSTGRLAHAGLLGAGTCFFGDLLDFADLPVTAQAARQAWRRSWLQRAMAATAGSACTGPDVGHGSSHARWWNASAPKVPAQVAPDLPGSPSAASAYLSRHEVGLR